MRLTFESVDPVKQRALPRVGGLIQSAEGPERTKRQRKKEWALSLTS